MVRSAMHNKQMENKNILTWPKDINPTGHLKKNKNKKKQQIIQK